MSLRKLAHVALALLFLVGMGSGLSACNAVEGVGEDISAAARGIKRSVFK